MAVPVIELDALLKSLDSIVKSTFLRLQNEYNQAIADGTPPNVAIQRIKDQVTLNQGSIVQGSTAMATQTSKSMRNVYHTLNQEWSTALEAAKKNPKTFQFFSKVGKNLILPQNAGYQVTVNELGDKIIRFSGGKKKDSIDAMIDQKNAEREYTRLSQEKQSIVKGKSALDKRNVNMIWIAVFRNTCKGCLTMHGTMKTRLEWNQGKIRPGSGDTECGQNCMCHLTPAQTVGRRLGVENDPTDKGVKDELIRRANRGIKVQSDRIKAMSKKRGKKYSDDYETQMLGQVQNERFNPWAVSGARTNLYLKTIPKNPVSKNFIKNVQVKG